MKYCPQCHQTYTDETLKFCRGDGTLLRRNSSVPDDSAATLVLPATPASYASSTQVLQNAIKPRRPSTVIAFALLTVVSAGIVYGIYKLTAKEDKPAISFHSAKFTRLTSTGKVAGVTISPDGKYVAHVVDDGGQQSLWVRQTATASDVEVVPPAAGATYRGFTFSPDGNYVYYTVSERDDRRGTLYQVPVLGGSGRKLLSHVGSAVTFSPDGKQLAFVRRAFVEGNREDSLVVANADGTAERTLAKTDKNVRLFRGPSFSSPSWSPDGKTIACPLGNTPENYMTVGAVSVETGEIKPLTSQRWFAVRQVAWLADSQHILFTAMDDSTGAPYQIWQLSYGTGVARRVSNDLINYRTFSLTASSDTMAVIKGEAEANIWVMPVSDSHSATQVTSGTSLHSELTWTHDGRIVYNSNASGSVDIYLLDLGGGSPKQLTANARSNSYPQATRDGRYIVFMSDRAGRPNIWRMDFDGGNQKQLTNGFDLHPYVSPDGKWIVYQSWTGQNTVRKVSIDGGEPVQLTNYVSGTPAISPDGKQIACSIQETPGSPLKIAILAPEGGTPLKTFHLPGEGETSSSVLRWTSDGREIVYGYMKKGVSNLWAQPVDGGKPRQITSFTSDRIFWFDFSPDGKRLALSRGRVIGDVVLIKDFK